MKEKKKNLKETKPEEERYWIVWIVYGQKGTEIQDANA